MGQENLLLKGLSEELNWTLTENGELALSSTGSGALLDLFALAGSLRSRVKDVPVKFACALAEDKLLATKLAFYARDIRGGLGEREAARAMFLTLANVHPDIMRKNLGLVAEFGRWDDLLVLLDTPVAEDVVALVKKQLESDVSLAKEHKPVSLLAKWLPSANTSSHATRRMARRLAKALGMDEKDYRKTLSMLRRHLNVTEVDMSAKEYGNINYEAVPSMAMNRHRAAFWRNDKERFGAYMEQVKSGRKKINAGALYPYDIVKKYTDKITGYHWALEMDPVIEEQWKSLPNYIEGENNILIMVDISGSMMGRPIATSIGLGIYFAERNKGAFSNVFMTFSQVPDLVAIKGNTLMEKVACVAKSKWGYNTDLEAAFDVLLKTAVKKHVPREEMPSGIIVISDGEIDCVLRQTKWTFVDEMKDRFQKAGYELPNLVLWNVESRHDVFHALGDAENVQLCSGQSASVFKTLLNSLNTTPYEYMLSVLNDPRYDAVKI